MKLSEASVGVLLAILYSNPNLAHAKTVKYTLVVHHEDVDTVKDNETFTRLGSFVNGTYPGPTLEADLGDDVVIRVINELVSSATTLHFHGQHQDGTYFYDGVPGVTQCPISAASSFEYRFTANPAGTFMYHSHVPYQFGDGVFGAFVVRDPENDPYAAVVADDVVVGLSDWLRYYSDRVYQYTSQFRFDAWPLAHYLSFINGMDPYHYEKMTPGSTYRLRIYAMTIEHGYRLHLAEHKMTVVAADGSYVAPVEVDFLDVYSGERYDVLVVANQNPDKVYEMRARVINFQGTLSDVDFTSALFSYAGGSPSPGSDEVSADAVMVDDFDTAEYSLLDQYALTAYKDTHGNFVGSYDPLPGGDKVLDDPWTYETTSYAVVGERQYAFMDAWDFHFAQKSPPDPLLFLNNNEELQRYAVEKSRPLAVSAYTSNNAATLEATLGPRIQYLELNEVVDIVFQNAPTLLGNELGDFGAVHPMHIHGHYFHVIAGGEGAFNAAEANANGNFVDPPQRDNIVVNPNSWALVRLKATNPGLWLLHCHSETHAVFGMSTTLAVGNAEERPSIPKGFPRCGQIETQCDRKKSKGGKKKKKDGKW